MNVKKSSPPAVVAAAQQALLHPFICFLLLFKPKEHLQFEEELLLTKWEAEILV